MFRIIALKLQIKYFGDSKRFKNMDKNYSFNALMRNHFISADQFFQNQGITQQVRNNINRFVKYCRTHKSFTRRMITLALNISYAELQTSSIQVASHTINEILANEEVAIAQLFFETESDSNSETCDIPQQLGSDIQNQAQRLFKFDDEDQQDQPQQQRPVQLQKDELATLSLEILKNPQSNQTCLGHLHKIYSFLIRHNPLPVLAFLAQKKDLCQLMLNNLRYSSVSSLVALLLTSEDKTKQYAHQNFKKSIIEQIISQLFNFIQDDEYFDGIMILVEEIINTTKQMYYQYFEDFKRVSNLLVSNAVMSRLYNIIISKQQKSFRNASKFLEYLFCRINSEREENNQYNRSEETEPSMNFQIDIYYENIIKLVQLIPEIQSFQNLTKISYMSFLEAMFSSNKMKQFKFALDEDCFIKLIDCLNHSQKAGIYKNKLYNIIILILKRASNEEISTFLANNENLYGLHFDSIRNANYSNTKIYNKNESSAFDVSIISQLSKKNQNVIQNASNSIGKDFKRICKKYETKVASFQNNNSFSLEEESNFYNYSNQKLQKGNDSNVFNFSLTITGKNNISIPTLQLPERKHQYNEQKENPHRNELIQSLFINGVKKIEQIEEVICLPEKLKIQNEEKKHCQIERPPQLSRNQKEKYQDIELTKVQPQVVKQSNITSEISSKRKVQYDEIRFYARHLVIFA